MKSDVNSEDRKKELQIFCVDDHPTTIDAYRDAIINAENEDVEIHFTQAFNCEEAFIKLSKIKKYPFGIDIALVDIKLPPFGILHSGADIVKLIKTLFPECKIIIITAFTEPSIVYNLLRETTVDAIISKGDIDLVKLQMIYKIVKNSIYFMSKTVKATMAEIAAKNLHLDQHDIEILRRIAEGKKTKDLPDYIDLNLSTIEKRKSYMKTVFLKKGRNDRELIEAVKRFGLI